MKYICSCFKKDFAAFWAISEGFIIAFSAIFYEKLEVSYQSVDRIINRIEDLCLLQGSKYVQSKIGNAYKQAKKLLTAGNKALFSGTLCQIAELKSYLGKTYDDLLTVGIICHGVPSEKIF